MSGREASFELELWGGAVERRYRARYSWLDALPWASLDPSTLDEDVRRAACASWTDLALQEVSASVEAARCHQLALAAVVPLDLGVALGEVASDELAHAELSARMAVTLGGAVDLRYRPDDLFAPHALPTGSRMFRAACAVAAHLWAGEALNLPSLKQRRDDAEVPLVREVWAALLRDEGRHAAVGRAFVDWASPQLTPPEREQVHQAALGVVERARRREAVLSELADAWFSPYGTMGARAPFVAGLAKARHAMSDELAAWRGQER